MAKPRIKTPEEIEAMRPAGETVARALKLVEEMAAPGITTAEIDRAVEALIRKAGGIPAFLDYPCPTPGGSPFPASICASINEEVVHGIPDDRTLKDGDLLSVDVGVELNGFFGDAARTFGIGDVSRKARKLIETTRECLDRATQEMRSGTQLRKICGLIQKTAEDAGYSVVEQFVGHGIGRAMHEPPQVPNYVSRAFGDGMLRLPAGTALAIEPMLNVGTHEVRVRPNGWTVITKDHALSAHFENTIAVTENGPLVLTEI